MFLPPITEEDKKLVGSLTKKKRQNGTPSLTVKKVKKVNVYFNKNNDNKGTYITGTFYSAKNNEKYLYRSSYELKFFQMLEENTKIVNYVCEAFSVPYLDSKQNKRNYIPDVLALDKKGNFIVYEIKPQEMLKDIDVQKKAQACKIYIKSAFGPSAKYQFITEKDLFETQKDYLNFIKENKKNGKNT